MGVLSGKSWDWHRRSPAERRTVVCGRACRYSVFLLDKVGARGSCAKSQWV